MNEVFTAPRPEESDFVRWFASGDPDKLSTADIAIVCRVDSRMVSLMVMTGASRGRRYDSVRHVSDPKLKLGKDQRLDGAWDYTTEYYRRREWEKKMENAIDGLRLNIGRAKAREEKRELVSQE